MVSKYGLVALFAVVAFLAYVFAEWLIVEQTIKELNFTKVIVIETNDAIVMLSHLKILNSTTGTIGICKKIYASLSPSNETDVVVLICSRAYVFYR